MFEAKILLIGIGGCGVNIAKDINNIDMLLINTDVQSLKTVSNKKNIKLYQLGENGLGTGMRPEYAFKLINEKKTQEEIKDIIANYDLLIIVNGLGGGTGSGVTPEILKIANELNKLTITISIFPFKFEGKKRNEIANTAFEKIKKLSNLYIRISNDNMLKYINETNNIKLSFRNSFEEINKVINKMIQGLLGVIKESSNIGDINIDFNDLRTVLEHKGKGIIGVGKGKNVFEAFSNAINKNILDYNELQNVKGIIINFITNENYPLEEITTFMEKEIYKYINEETDVIFGTTTKDIDYVEIIIIASLNNEVKIKKNKKEIFKFFNKEYNSYQNYDIEELDLPSFLRIRKI